MGHNFNIGDTVLYIGGIGNQRKPRKAIISKVTRNFIHAGGIKFNLKTGCEVGTQNNYWPTRLIIQESN